MLPVPHHSLVYDVSSLSEPEVLERMKRWDLECAPGWTHRHTRDELVLTLPTDASPPPGGRPLAEVGRAMRMGP